eukprot:364398-Chlamydomonas_euryale.AAC.19
MGGEGKKASLNISVSHPSGGVGPLQKLASHVAFCLSLSHVLLHLCTPCTWCTKCARGELATGRARTIALAEGWARQGGVVDEVTTGQLRHCTLAG